MLVKVNLNNNYKIVKEGERILEITDAKVSPSGMPSKLTIIMKDIEDGAQLQNSYDFTNSTGAWLMGILLNLALGLGDGDDFNTDDCDKLIGVRLKCEVKHTESNGKTYANIARMLEKVESQGTEISNEDLQNAINNMYSSSVSVTRNAVIDKQDDLA